MARKRAMIRSLVGSARALKTSTGLTMKAHIKNSLYQVNGGNSWFLDRFDLILHQITGVSKNSIAKWFNSH
jgi:hypothetical protein